ncbi:MAG: transporter [SAR86 cluster bacterium]|uniref:Transporter n=1 Tax=SAR86 cluster bacterium TaxID=2030880 RepID=A0A2A5CGP3_9GAMM|nr:AEC family transporter [Gammaproteobacteria bacterium AH-315-E17]PCJ42675.1 MAG: transporter [SAR86 cluster bacterium]
MLYEILSILAPVFICAFIGYLWVKLQQPFDSAFATQLIVYVSTPCLIFSTFMEVEIDKEAFLNLMLAAFMTTMTFGLIAWPILKALKIDLHAFLPSQMFPNCGNMGLPLCMLAFGEEGLALGLTYFTVNVFFHFSIGMSISAGHISFKTLLRNPIFITIFITMLMVFNDIKAPAWIYNSTEILGGISIPLMLIALGVSLAQFKISSLKLSLSLSLFRLGLGFIVSVLIAELLGLEGASRGVLILQSTMPIAVFSYLFAAQNKRRPEEVAGTVVLSTLISFITLPFLLLYLLA